LRVYRPRRALNGLLTRLGVGNGGVGCILAGNSPTHTHASLEGGFGLLELALEFEVRGEVVGDGGEKEGRGVGGGEEGKEVRKGRVKSESQVKGAYLVRRRQTRSIPLSLSQPRQPSIQDDQNQRDLIDPHLPYRLLPPSPIRLDAKSANVVQELLRRRLDPLGLLRLVRRVEGELKDLVEEGDDGVLGDLRGSGGGPEEGGERVPVVVGEKVGGEGSGHGGGRSRGGRDVFGGRRGGVGEEDVLGDEGFVEEGGDDRGGVGFLWQGAREDARKEALSRRGREGERRL
jgi:hypothetical protein